MIKPFKDPWLTLAAAVYVINLIGWLIYIIGKVYRYE